MHYLPITLPIFVVLFFVFLFLIALIEVGILSFAYERLGINSRYIFTLLLLSLLGSYVNIPIYQLPPEQVASGSEVVFFGMHYVIPLVKEWPGTIIAVNVGGAVIPALLSFYLIVKNRLYGRAVLGVTVVALIIHSVAYPVKGLGIAEPIFIPPLIATLVAIILAREFAPALAYISGSLGTLIGADILNLGAIRGLGAPIASIGGAGTFDGIFLTGILAVLLASLLTPRNSA